MDLRLWRAKYKALTPALTERGRRIWAATEARAAGRPHGFHGDWNYTLHPIRKRR